MSLTFRARALGPLRNVEWNVPKGVSVVVGPNRVGKSTLLRLPELVKIAYYKDLSAAVEEVFEGTAFLRTFSVPRDQKSSLGLSAFGCSWEVDLAIRGASIAPLCAETLVLSSGRRIVRAQGSAFAESEDSQLQLGPRLLLSFFAEEFFKVARELEDKTSSQEFELRWRDRNGESLRGFAVKDAFDTLGLSIAAELCLSYRTYHYQISHLLKYGSPQSPERVLRPSGENVFPLLRNWRDSGETEARFEFVLENLTKAFKHVGRFNFEQAGQTVTMSIQDKRWSDSVPISRESTGLVTALLQLCAVASCQKGGLVTIDELETSLHPHAIRVLIEAFREWAKLHDLSIVLATQSETVLDQFRDQPSHVFVIEPNQDVSPRPLTEMFDADWLSQFSLGDLFAHLEFGSNDGPAAG